MALLIVFGYFVLVVLSVQRAGGDRIHVMQRWFGVPAMEPVFADLWHITSGWDAARAGLKPEEANPYDQFNRAFTYPRIWLWPALVGATSRITTTVALAMIIGFIATAFYSVGRLTWREGVIFGLLFIGPPVVLALERCNVDLLVFMLVALAGLLAARAGRGERISAVLLLFTASIAKLHPVGCAACLLRSNLKGSVMAVVSFFGLIGAFFLFTLTDILRISRILPQVSWFSYGGRIAYEYLVRAVEGALGRHLPEWLPAAGYLVLLGGLMAAAWCLWSKSPAVRWPKFGGTEQHLFLAGAGIFLLSFAALKSFEYRYSFLLLCLPLLFSMLRRGRKSAIISRMMLILLGLLFYDSLAYGILSDGLRRSRVVNWSYTLEAWSSSWLLFVFTLILFFGLVRTWLIDVSSLAQPRTTPPPDL